MTLFRTLMLSAMTLALAACASAPAVRYYTLQAPAPAPAQPTVAGSGLWIQMLPVRVPAQVDVPELVVRQGAGQLARVETQQWIAPLPDEVRAALSQRVQDHLGARDVHGLGQVDPASVHRIRVVLTRFDAYPGDHVDVSASWTLNAAQTAVALTCATRVHQPVGAGYPALVAGYQRALAGIGDAIAGTIAAGAQRCVDA